MSIDYYEQNAGTFFADTVEVDMTPLYRRFLRLLPEGALVLDLPAIDTVLMLRPTESKVLFLQQLGRGLRRHPDKEHLIVLDFIGNHQGFLNKPQALFGVGSSYRQLAELGLSARDGQLKLPPGCFANYDLAIIDFLLRLQGKGPATDYQALRDSLNRRPTLAEFYRSGSSMQDLRRRHGQWWALVADQGDLTPAESACLGRHADLFRAVETTSMTKCFKAVLLESLLELVDSEKAGSITGDVMAIERQDVSGDDQYVLRLVTKQPDGRYVLKAANPDYPDFEANDEMRPLARVRAVWSGEG
jgi:hypothetical protein